VTFSEIAAQSLTMLPSEFQQTNSSTTMVQRQISLDVHILRCLTPPGTTRSFYVATQSDLSIRPSGDWNAELTDVFWSSTNHV